MRRQYAHLHLHGTDVEALAYRVINTWQRKHTTLNPTDTEDLLAYLVATTWELAQKHDPRRSTRFDPYSLLLLRCNDWLRKDEGRTVWKFAGHTHTRPPRQRPLSLDAERDHDGPLAATLPDKHSHPQTDHDPDDVRRLLAESLRHQDRDHRTLRTSARWQARNRTPRARAA